MKCYSAKKASDNKQQSWCPHTKGYQQVGSCPKCPQRRLPCNLIKDELLTKVNQIQAPIALPNDSKICPPYPEPEPDLIVEENSKEKLITDVVEDILWQKCGEHQPLTSSCCSSVSLQSEPRVYESRLNYWKKYLADRQQLENKIKTKTGKTTSEILLNQANEHRNVQLVKTILDYTERIGPTRLSARKILQLPDYECLDKVFETIPRLEKYPSKIEFNIVGVPKECKTEQGMGDMGEKRQNSWLNSKYLETKIMRYSKEIHKLLFFYPDTDQLQICGLKLAEKEIVELSDQKEDDRCIFQEPCKLICPGLKTSIDNPQMDFVVEINQTRLFVLNKIKFNLEFNVSFHCKENSKMKKGALIFENVGNNLVDFEWLPKAEFNDQSLHLSNSAEHPTFFFDKNSFRLCPNQLKELPVVFFSDTHGIYTEKWVINSEPSFCDKGVKIYLNLFGICYKSQKVVSTIFEIEDTLSQRANENMIRSIIIMPVADPPPFHCYNQFFSDRELFVSLSPHLNCSQYTLECLEALYNEANKHLGCPKWNYDLKDLRKLIIDHKDYDERKMLYDRFLALFETLRTSKFDGPDLPRQSTIFFKVRNILLGFVEKLVNLTEEINQIVLPTDLDLRWNEVILNNSQKLPNEMKFSHPAIDDLKSASSSDDFNSNKDCLNLQKEVFQKASITNFNSESELSFFLVKSKHIREKRKKMSLDSLYVQTYSLLCIACEEIAGVVEAQKNEYPVAPRYQYKNCTPISNPTDGSCARESVTRVYFH